MQSNLLKSVFEANTEGVLDCLRSGADPNERGMNGAVFPLAFRFLKQKLNS